ncbi:MAG: hypothetical protein GQ477_03270 [Nanohaloarchaea archaeon]|nr:hypothetical protein [Candidatus Nanohaloarchaea archaeon]
MADTMADESMLTVVVGAFVLIAGIIGLASYSSDGSGFDLDLSALKAPTGNLLKGMFQSSTETVQFSARLLSSEHQNMQFKFRDPVESIVLRYTIPNPSISLMDMEFPSDNMSIEFYEFKGDVIISEKTTILGKVSSFTLKDASSPISSKREIPLVIENLSLDHISVSGMSDKSFDLKNVYGVINISAESGNLVYQKNTGDMEIRSFDGDLWIDDGIIYIKGTGILKADVLNSPGI